MAMNIDAAVNITADVSGQNSIERLADALRNSAKASNSMKDAGQALILSLRDQIATVTQSESDLTLYRAALLGVSDQVRPLVAELDAAKESIRAKAAAEAAAAKAAREHEDAQRSAAKAAAAMKESGQALVQSVRDQIAAISDSESNLTLYRAALLGVSDQVRPLVAELEAAREATKAKAAADAAAAKAARDLDAAEKAAASTRDRFISGLREQVATMGMSSSQMLQYRAQQLGITAEAAPLIAQLNAQSNAYNNVGANARQMTAMLRMVPAQFTDIATQLAGGQNPMLILIQQGGQLKDMFGGIGPATRVVGGYILSLITPVNTLIAAFAGLGFAMYKGSDQSIELKKQLLLTGGAAGYTAGQIEELSRKLRDNQTITAGAARDLTTGLAATGQFVGKNLDVAVSAAAKLQKLSNQSSEEITKDFAAMSNGVAAWASEHNKHFNYLSLAQFKHIKQLEEMGDKEGALKENINALNAALEGRRRNLGYIEQGWEAVKRAISGAGDALLSIGREKTPEDNLTNLKKKLEDLEKIGRDSYKAFTEFGEYDAGTEKAKKIFDDRRQMLLEQIAVLQKDVDKAQADEAEKAKKNAKTRQEIEEEQSGKAEALAAAMRKRNLASYQNQLDDRLSFFEQEGQLVESKYRAGLITEQEYNDKKLDIAKETLNARMKFAEQEEKIEQSRKPHSKADEVEKETKLLQLRGQLNQLEAQKNLAGLKASEAQADSQRKMQEGFDKFKSTQEAHIEQIKLESEATGMSALEHRKRAEALRISKEVTDAAIGKTPEYIAKIKEEAREQRKATLAALDAADAKARSFGSGMDAAFRDYREKASNTAKQTQMVFQDAFQGMEDALTNFVKTGKLDFKSLADSLITDMIRITIQRQIMLPLMGTGIDGDFGIMGGLFSGVKSWFSANGNVMTDNGPLPLNKYANGGIAKHPQVSVFGEGKMPEAYVPLPDGRSIPVSMQGGGGSNVTVNVVNNAANTKATAQERTDSNGQRIIDVIIEQVKASIAGDISRGVGTVTAALERTYGANRAAGAY